MSPSIPYNMVEGTFILKGSSPTTGRVGVFWDFFSCAPPTNLPGYVVSDNIRRLAHTYGSVTLFKAYLDLSQNTSPHNLNFRSELQSSGVSLTDCSFSQSNDIIGSACRDQIIACDMLAFALDNPAPATIILISGNRNFAFAFSVLRQRRYDTILVTPAQGVHISLNSQATRVLDWDHDVLHAQNAFPMSGKADQSNPMEPRFSSFQPLCSPPLPPISNMFRPTMPLTPPEQSSSSTSPLTRVDPSSPSRAHPQSPSPITMASRTPLPLSPQSDRGRPQKSKSPPPRVVSPLTLPAIQRSLSLRDPIIPTRGVPQPKADPMSEANLPWPTGSRPLPAPRRSLENGTQISPIARPRSNSVIGSGLPSFWTPTPAPTGPPGPPQPSISQVEQGWRARQGSILNPIPSRPLMAPIAPRPMPAQMMPPTGFGTAGSKPLILSSPWQSSNITPVPSTVLRPNPSLAPTSPGQFSTLIELLKKWRAEGNSRPLRSAVGAELRKLNSNVYQAAGVVTFGEYVSLAVAQGLVKLGNGDFPGREWISLSEVGESDALVDSVNKLIRDISKAS
ncbi:hypothetical protein BOTBODRAFT_43732 [Botryobasidium botryosum FD-172 SS1]|uniref:NYN domain-containing protein n=1 Tax=Botryobasidium botryosum (strain FD-172 SS1) TaxID=930990 RepID=A0A067MKS7_BOTB1|nr:hypothetical protein BOTBODRAFT_43732 [Botryobasidium botryosum FD-172 SS1]